MLWLVRILELGIEFEISHRLESAMDVSFGKKDIPYKASRRPLEV